MDKYIIVKGSYKISKGKFIRKGGFLPEDHPEDAIKRLVKLGVAEKFNEKAIARTVAAAAGQSSGTLAIELSKVKEQRDKLEAEKKEVLEENEKLVKENEKLKKAAKK